VPEPAPLLEVGQRLVDRLARGADELGELLLRQVVRDVHALVARGAEALRQVEQRLGHPTGDVAEDEVGHRLVGAAQALGQGPQQLAGDLGADR
jgi:hypothetical protein